MFPSIFRIFPVMAMLVVASFFTISTLSQANARPKLIKVCKQNKVHGASALRKYKYTAQVNARYRWRRKVINRYGLKWASWTNSRGRKTRCHKNAKRNKWRCVAKAKPCIWRLRRDKD